MGALQGGGRGEGWDFLKKALMGFNPQCVGLFKLHFLFVEVTKFYQPSLFFFEVPAQGVRPGAKNIFFR